MLLCMGNQRAKAAYPPFGGATLQTKERRAMPMYVTYADLFQFCMFIVALIGLCYQIFKDNKKK